ncbi:MAG TPA: S-layer homology domain-containing protein [Abditibacteriaceae bacterium]|jgi:hypothetical protein|nr:S-layer homology domain-containing protein [Abditibacteriaceae bacterium]
MKKFLLIAAAIALLSARPSVAQSTFRDVPDNHWAAEAVKRLAEAGIIEGRPESSSRADKMAVAPARKTTKVASKPVRTARVATSKTTRSAGR